MRQRRDKGPGDLAVKAAGDPHQNIPRDDRGNPIFLILPTGVGASYERRMESCRSAWETTHDPAAVSEAATYVFLHRQPIPRWLHDAIVQLAADRRTKTHANRAIDRAKHSMRYQAVRDARKSGLTWERSYERASEDLAGTSAAAEPGTMKDSYGEVAGALKNGRGGLYNSIQIRAGERRIDRPQPSRHQTKQSNKS